MNQLARPQQSLIDCSERSRQIDSAAWAVFFIRAGATMLARVPWRRLVTGIGAPVPGAQPWRRQMALEVDGFAVFLAGGAALDAASCRSR